MSNSMCSLFMGYVATSLVVGAGSNAFAAEQKYGGIAIEADDVKIGAREYSPHLDQGYPQRVFWGDTHLHTSYFTGKHRQPFIRSSIDTTF